MQNYLSEFRAHDTVARKARKSSTRSANHDYLELSQVSEEAETQGLYLVH